MENQLVVQQSHQQGQTGPPCPLARPGAPQALGALLEAQHLLGPSCLPQRRGPFSKNQAMATQTEFLGLQGRYLNSKAHLIFKAEVENIT